MQGNVYTELKFIIQGDSGGPLMCPSESGDKTMHGIVSWGHVPCGQAEYPGVFTRTAHFMDWIEEHL